MNRESTLLSGEKWKRLEPPFQDYYISSHGRVSSVGRKKGIKKGNIMKDGYHRTRFNLADGTNKSIKTHRLVAEAFISKIEGKTYVNHKNGIKHDNRVENLEWCTAKENYTHAVQTGLKKSAGQINRETKGRLVVNLDYGVFYDSAGEAYESMPVISFSGFRAMLYGTNKNKYRFEFEENVGNPKQFP